MSNQREQRGSAGTAHDALVVAAGTARLAGWIGLALGIGTLIFTFLHRDNYWTFFTLGVVMLGFGITWSLLARIGGALGAMVGK